MLILFSLFISRFIIDSTLQDSIVLRTLELEQINITANKIPTQNLETAYSIHKLSATQIRNRLNRTTPEALQGTAGVFVQKTNHGGGSPILRGLMGNQTLLVLDGIRLNNSTYRYGPNQYLNTVDPFTLNKIEILNGSGSVQYGSDAMGGVIHLFSHEPELNTNLVARFLGRFTSQQMEQTGRAEINYGGNRFAGSASINVRNFGDLYGGKGIGRQSPSGYGENSNFIKLKYVLRNNTFVVSNQYFNANHVPITHKVKLENFKINEISKQNRNLSYIKHTWSTNSKWLTELNTILSLHHTLEQRESQKNNSNQFIFEKDRVNTISVNSSFTTNFSSHWKAITGIELYTDKVSSKKELTNLETKGSQSVRGLYPDQSKYGSFSSFTIHQFNLNPLLISGGIRYNRFKININESGIGQVQITPSALVYNANLGYRMNKYTTTYLAVNSGYRAPNIDDMGTLGIVDFRYELPSFDLKPEHSRSYEIGLKMIKPNYQITGAFYHTYISNLITRTKIPDQIISGYPVYIKENIGEAIIRGIENTMIYNINQNFQLNSLLTYTYGKNKITQEPLRRIPPFFGRLSLQYELKRFFISSEWSFAGSQHRLAQGDKEDNRIGPEGTPGWNVINLYTGLKLRNATVQAVFNNLTNEAYKTHGSGVYGQGRSLTLQIQYTIQKKPLSSF